MTEKKCVKRAGQGKCVITLHFSETPNPQVEEKVMRILVDSYENRLNLIQKIDRENPMVV